ncbi:hypothetical protein RZS08_03245, partial [Arthrospira platensis SPKY1]|nr:hypothetical protein [Arthrospira platensis SPKY1]
MIGRTFRITRRGGDDPFRWTCSRSRASFCSWVAIVAPLDDRRPVGGASCYRAAAAVASIFARPACGNPNRTSHRRDELVSREEPHVFL